jgi:membrane-bound lytic murein transglycosylase D
MLVPFQRKLGRATGVCMIAVLALIQLAPPAWAVYDHAVSWSDMSSLDLRPVLASQYASSANLLEPSIPESANELVLRDADNLIHADFHVPAEMRPLVGFWLRIYTEFTTQHVVLFDSHHPEVIYEVMDFRELAKTARNAIVYEILQERRIKQTVAKYKQAFAQLAKNPKPRKPTPEQTNILSALRRTSHKHKISEFANNMRAQTGQRDNVVKGLLAAEGFFPRMEQIFAKNGIPTELTRLALVESSFDLSAKSRVGAAGVWQFMRPSAKEYMRVDDQNQIDERLSPLKATFGAAKLLGRGKKMFGNWPLAVTSYNQGLALPRQFKNPAKDGPKIFKLFATCGNTRLKWAGRNYYAEFLAILHAESYRKLYYGHPPTPSLRPTVFAHMKESKSGLELAMSHGVSFQEFKFMNPDIRDMKRKLPKGFLVALPGERDDIASLFQPFRRKG